MWCLFDRMWGEICGEQYTGSTKKCLGLGQITRRVRRGSL